MLKLTLLEFFLRVIPEAMTFILGVHAWSKIQIYKKNFLLSSFLLAVGIFMIRMMPISYGIHTLLTIIVVIILMTQLQKIDIVKAIRGSIITIICQFCAEMINAIMITTLFKQDLEMIFEQPLLKIIYGLPSLGIAMGIMLIVYKQGVGGKGGSCHED